MIHNKIKWNKNEKYWKKLKESLKKATLKFNEYSTIYVDAVDSISRDFLRKSSRSQFNMQMKMEFADEAYRWLVKMKFIKKIIKLRFFANFEVCIEPFPPDAFRVRWAQCLRPHNKKTKIKK